MCVIKMSSSMQNFMEAYAAVHNTEAREELSSNRDLISEMDLSHLTSTDLVEIAEQVLEVAFETLTVQEAHEVITSMLSEETEIAGRAHKTDRLLEGFNKAFAEVGSKAASVALEHFAQYRHNKKLQETWTSRFNQEKRVQRVHGRQVAEDVASVKAKLLALLELYKGKHGQSEKEYQDGRSQGGKMISGDSKMSGAKYSHGRRVSDGGAGPQPAGGSKKPKAQGRMDSGTRTDLLYRKANLKKEEVEQIEEKKKMSKKEHIKAAKAGKRWQDSDGDGKWYEKGEDVAEGSMKTARANVGADKCWDGYKAKGTKKKGGKTVPNCVKEDEVLEGTGMHRDAKTGKVVDKAEVGKTYYPNMPKKKTSVALRKEKEMKKESVAFSQKELDAFEAIVNSWED